MDVKLRYNCTLCFPLKTLQTSDHILLGMKKHGFGKGKWNGFGGKIKPGESIHVAAIRELKEESNLDAVAIDLISCATLNFYFLAKPEWNQIVHAYLLRNWVGKPIESTEMCPRWFDVNKLPFDFMWPDDRFWLPDVLSGKYIRASFIFDASNSIVEVHYQANKQGNQL